MHVDSYTLMTPSEAQDIVNLIKDRDWRPGQAKTAEATAKVKHNLELKSDDDPVAKEVLHEIGNMIGAHKAIQNDHFISNVLRPKFNKYAGGGEYDRHGDAAVMANTLRTDLSCTVFLSHSETYTGGDLCIEGPAGGHVTVKGGAGTCVVYPCHWPHWVEPVTEGERICAITWLQSRVRDQAKREILRRFHRVLKEIEGMPEEAWGKHHTSLATICGYLVRQWIEPL